MPIQIFLNRDEYTGGKCFFPGAAGPRQSGDAGAVAEPPRRTALEAASDPRGPYSEGGALGRGLPSGSPFRTNPMMTKATIMHAPANKKMDR